MRHALLRVWLGTGVVGLTLVLGCNQGQRQCKCCCQKKPCGGCDGPAMIVPDGQGKVMAANPVPARPDSLPPFNAASQEATQVAQALPPSPAPPPGMVQSGPWSRAPVADGSLRQASHNDPSSRGGEEPVRRRTFSDITADPSFGHAPDYSWLIGRLEFLHVRNVWKVRYASLEEEDRYGGSVTLIDTGPMTEFKSGQIVRVEGQLVNPESREPSPPYRVRSI